jgi:hypothetical protein
LQKSVTFAQACNHWLLAVFANETLVRGLQNCGFQVVAVSKLKAHPVLPGEIATASIYF